jgi:glutaredoxin
MTGTIALELLTRRDCGLCDKALRALEAVGRDLPLSLTLRDVDADEALLREFHIRVPVVRLADGAVLCEGVVTEAALRAALGGVAVR